MLAADAAVAVAPAASHPASEVMEPHGLTHQQGPEQPSVELVLIDGDVTEHQQLQSMVRPGTEVVLLTDSQSAITQITTILAERRDVSAIHLVSHASSGQLQIAGQTVTRQTLLDHAKQIRSWRGSLTENADILIYGCDAAQGKDGNDLLTTLAELTQADVAGSVDRTGDSSHGGDWQLERHIGTIDADLFASVNTLRETSVVLPITVYAAGLEGDEQMSLQIDGVTVETWDNVGGNASARLFQQFNYESEPGITADRVRVTFNNDLYDPAGGVNRNLRVDRIEIDGQTFQTEDPGVFSTGTWLPEDGITPGFRESEILHTNGYFEYSQPQTGGSEIVIFAAGSENTETMQLWIGGQLAETWTNVGGDASAGDFDTFVYNTDDVVDAEDVQIFFTNAQYDPAAGIDSNLRIDRILINSASYQTEDPTVFSTGTWKPEDGITPGFRESETLHGNGYFHFGQSPASGSQILISAAGSDNTETMELWIAGERVQTWEGVQGNARTGQFVTYVYNADSLVTPDEIQIHFTNPRYQPDQGIDSNLRIDRLTIDSVGYETESPNVYSTGTWKPADGVVPGFRESEWLHSGGFFEFGNSRNAGVIALETSVISVEETASEIQVNVVRSEGSDGQITVDFEVANLTATAGEDFVAQAGTLVLGEGETSAVILVSLLDDGDVEGPEQFSVTIDNVNGGATLLVPRTATVTIEDDEVELPQYADFASLDGLQVNGAALQSGDRLRLTPDTTNQAGSAFFDTQVSLAQDGSFRSRFQFELDGGSDGADGLAFVIQNDPTGAAAIGASGGALGYNGIGNSIAVEFDTYQNGSDVNNNHVSILSGSVDNSLRTLTTDIDLNGGQTVYAWVEYNGSSDVLAVYLSETDTKPELALLKSTIDLESEVGSSAYFGFTAGTGGRTNAHEVLSWTLDQQVPPADPPTQAGDTVQGVTIVDGVNQPTAIEWLPDGAMLIAEKGGVVRVADGGTLESTPFVDISDIVNGVRDRGLLDIAVHPDFANNPYVYLLFTYDPPEVFDQDAGTLAGPDGKGNRAGRLIRVTADVTTGYRTAVPGSEVVLLGTNSTWDNFNGFANSTFDFDEPPAGENPDGSYVRDFIPSDSESHTVGGLAFGIDGELFVSIGDGASYNRVDPRADRVQDIDSLSGKVLRIDPITGQGLSDNPFYNDDPGANRSKVWQMGLRNPFRISVDQVTGQLYIGDVGWTRWEEVNSAGAGANFGWPFYEGGSGESLVNTRYRDTPEGAAFFAQNIPVDASIYALNHQADGINAIVMGDAYRGGVYGAEYEGDIFFNDLGQGIVRHASIDAEGNVVDVNTFTTGASVVVAISEGPDGFLYYVDLNDNRIGRWELV